MSKKYKVVQLDAQLNVLESTVTCASLQDAVRLALEVDPEHEVYSVIRIADSVSDFNVLSGWLQDVVK